MIIGLLPPFRMAAMLMQTETREESSSKPYSTREDVSMPKTRWDRSIGEPLKEPELN